MSVFQVIAVDGLTGGGSNADVILGIANTQVTPSVYGSSSKIPKITVNQRGQITLAEEVEFTTGLGAIVVGDTVLNTTSNATVRLTGTIGTTISANADTNTITIGVDQANIAVGGRVDTVVAGAGILTVGTPENLTVSLANTAVTPGQYGNTSYIPVIDINSRGQITSATSVKHTTGLGAIVVGDTVLNTTSNTTVQLTGTVGTTISANADTNTITIGVDPSNIVAGGQLDQVVGGSGILVSGNAEVATISLANTSVAQGQYGTSSKVPRFTVNHRGQITSVTEVPVAVGLSGATVDGTSLFFNSTAPVLSLLSGDGVQLSVDAGNNQITVGADVAGTLVVSDIAARDALAVVAAGQQVFVQDTGEGNWGLFMWVDNGWEQITNQGKLTAPDSKTVSVQVQAPAGAVMEPLEIVQLPTGTKIVSITASVQDPFMGGQTPAELEVMFEGQVIMNAALSDLSAAGDYMAYPELLNMGAASTVSATMYYNGATGGALSIKITYV